MALTREVRWPVEQPVLAGGTIVLRPWQPGDAAAVFAACQDPAIQRYTLVPVPYRREDAQSFVGGLSSAMWTERTGASFAIASAATGEALGACGLVGVDVAAGVVDIGYWVAPGARRAGVASEALAIISAWSQDHLGFEHIRLEIEPENIGSIKAAARAGFVVDERAGFTRKHKGRKREFAVLLLEARTS